MANKNFVVHNGLEVGPVTIFSANGDIVSSGNITSTSSGSTATVAVSKYVMQYPPALASLTWYKLGTFTVNSGSGAGEAAEITMVAGQGYAGDATAKDIIEVRFQNGSGPNIEANYYSLGYKEGVQGVKVKSVNSSSTDTSWDIYVYLSSDLGKGFVEVKVTNDAKFQWVNTSTTDPGSASSTLVVATNKFVTATSNVVITSGNLYVGGNIYQSGALVSTSASSGFITSTVTGNGTTGPYSLSNTPADSNQIAVWWDGVYQPKSTYTLNNNQLTFSEAIPSGSIVEVKILAGSGVSALGTLIDVDLSASPTNGQYLSYNSATSKWVPSTGLAATNIQNQAIIYSVALGGF